MTGLRYSLIVHVIWPSASASVLRYTVEQYWLQDGMLTLCLIATSVHLL